MFCDKAKQVTSATVTEACPNYTFCTSDVIVCSKCSTQVSKGQCPSWAASNNLAPDDIPTQLASLTPDEVRTISLVCPFLKVILLPGGQFGEEGSVIHFPFPVQHVMHQLPRPLVESELILTAVGPESSLSEPPAAARPPTDPQSSRLAQRKQSSLFSHPNAK